MSVFIAVLALMLAFAATAPVADEGSDRQGAVRFDTTGLIPLHVAEKFDRGLQYSLSGDYAEAKTWFEKAAAEGYALAHYFLGLIYENGKGVPQDYAMAREWYEKAAAQGHAAAQYNLGVMYSRGEGVPQDHVQAYAWFNVAAAGGQEKAATFRDEVAGRLDSQSLMRAQALSREYFERYSSGP